MPDHCSSESEIENYIAEYREKEGILLEKEKIRKDEVLRTIAKLLLNSLWSVRHAFLYIGETFLGASLDNDKTL